VLKTVELSVAIDGESDKLLWSIVRPGETASLRRAKDFLNQSGIVINVPDILNSSDARPL
jgi:hypothetical protein